MAGSATKMLSDAARRACEEQVTRFPKKDGALLNVLRIVEAEFGFLDPASVAMAADFCGMPHAKAWGVFTFYSTFRTNRDGKNIMWVCSTLPCALRGSEALYDHIRSKLDLNEHGTTPDGLLSLKKAECIGACGTAPCVQLNEDYYENLSFERADRLLADIRSGVARPAGYTA